MIRFENVSRNYGVEGQAALEDITVEFYRGDFVCLIGASGSGKSTLLRLILREGLPTQGRVTVAGQNLTRMLQKRVPEYRRSIGMIFQDFRLLPDKTVYENVAFAMRVTGASRSQIRPQVMKTLSRVGLEHLAKRYPHEISGGEQQRTAIARAIINKPAIVLADEPTGNLDPRASREVMKILRWINDAGTTVVMATHDRGIVNQLQRRVVQLHHGGIIRDVEPGLYDPPQGSAAWTLLAEEEAQTGLRESDPMPVLTGMTPVVAVDPVPPESPAVDESEPPAAAVAEQESEEVSAAVAEPEPPALTEDPEEITDELPAITSTAPPLQRSRRAQQSSLRSPAVPQRTVWAVDQAFEAEPAQNDPQERPRKWTVRWPETHAEPAQKDPWERGRPATSEAANLWDLTESGAPATAPQQPSQRTESRAEQPSRSTAKRVEQPGQGTAHPVARTSQPPQTRPRPVAPYAQGAQPLTTASPADPQSIGAPSPAPWEDEQKVVPKAPRPVPKPRESAAETTYADARATAEQMRSMRRWPFNVIRKNR